MGDPYYCIRLVRATIRLRGRSCYYPYNIFLDVGWAERGNKSQINVLVTCKSIFAKIFRDNTCITWLLPLFTAMTLLETNPDPDSDNPPIRFLSWILVSNFDFHFYS